MRSWTRDEALELCLEVLATGRIHGVPADHDPDVLATRIGTSFVQNPSGALAMWRDWGLVEAHYHRASPESPWECLAFVVQAHRMKKPPKWSWLAAELDGHGYQAERHKNQSPGYDGYTVTASNSSALVAREDEGGVQAGRVPKLTASPDPLPPAHWPSFSFKQYTRELRTVADAGPQTWPRWLERRGPDPRDWASLVHTLGLLRRDHPERDAEWTALGLWLLDQARTAEAWPRAEWAWRWARFVRERPGTAPPGEIARECLAALPMTPAEAEALPASWRETSAVDVLRSRLTRALVRFAGDDPGAGTGAGPAPWHPVIMARWHLAIRHTY